MPGKLFFRESLIEKSLYYEIRWAQEPSGESVLLFFLMKLFLVVGMFVIGRQGNTQPVALFLHDLHGKTRVCIWPFQHRGNPESRRCSECFQCARRPCVDDVNLSREFLNSTGHNMIM